MKRKQFYILMLFLLLFSCHSKKEEETAAEGTEEETVTPVTVTTASSGTLTESIELNATSTFLQRAFIKANANGYIQTVNAQVGKMVSAGQSVFVIQTKESRSIGNTINILDTSFKFSGIITIR